MAEFDDLFAGFEVKGKVIPGPEIAAQAAPKGIQAADLDLFEGFQVGDAPPISAQPVEGVTEPTQPDERLTLVRAAETAADAAQAAGKPIQGVIESVIEAVTGAGRETRATRELPELGEGGLLSGEDPAKGAALAPVLATTFDPAEISQIVTSNFPNIKQTQDEAGNLILNNTATGAKVVVNKPGLSGLDVIQGVATAAAFTPAARLAGAGTQAAAQATKGVVGRRALQAAAGAGVTEAAIQTGQEAAGGEFDPEDVALSAGAGALAETVVPAVQAVRQGRAQRAIGAEAEELALTRQAVEEGAEAAEAVGGRLFPAQQTVLPAQLEKQSFIGSLPAGTRRATDQLRAQNVEAERAVTDFLGTIAPDTAVVTGAEKFRTAAEAALEKAKNIRREKTSPLFNQAFKEGADVDIKPVRDLIKENLGDLPKNGEIARSLNKVLGLIKGKKDAKPTLRQLQNSKLEIDQMLNKVGENSLGNTTKRQLTEVKTELLKQMDEGSPLFREARLAFAEASPAVTKVQDSIIGKVAALDDVQLKTASRRIFDAAETNPAVINNAKRIIDDVDPDAWNELLRAELERRLGSIKSTLSETTTENVPGQMFRALFGNAKQRAILFNSVDGETAANMKYLETFLKRASLGRPGGSQTATREEIKRELRGGVVSSLRDFFSSPVKTLVSVGDDSAFDRRVSAMANAMFDPQWRPQIRQLRQLNPNSPAAARAMTQLLRDAENEIEEE